MQIVSYKDESHEMSKSTLNVNKQDLLDNSPLREQNVMNEKTDRQTWTIYPPPTHKHS